MYNFEELFTPSTSLNLAALTECEMVQLEAEESEATQHFHAAAAQCEALWARLEDVATMASVTAMCSEKDSSITGTGYHMAGVAAHLATKGLPENVREINAFESNGETFDLVEAGEGFKEVIESVWTAIKNGRTKFWRWLKRMWAKSVGRYARLRRSLNGLKERADSLAQEGKVAESGNIDVTSGINSFYYAGKIVNKPEDVIASYKHTTSMTKFFYGDYLNALKKNLPSVEKAINDADLENPKAASVSIGKALNDVRRANTKLLGKVAPRDTATGLTDIKHITTTANRSDLFAIALMGNSVLISYKDITLVDQVNAVQTSIFSVYDWDTKKNKTDRISMPVATLEQVRDFCNDALQACDQILMVLDKSGIDKVGESAERANKAMAKYKTNASKVSSETIAKDTATVSSILQATKKVDSWLTGVINQISTNYASTTSAIAGYMSKSLSQYK